MKPTRVMITYKDPLSSKQCVRWFKHLGYARKFIRDLAYDVPYMVTVSDTYSFRGSYFVREDLFIEFPKFGRDEYKGSVYDKFGDLL